MNGGRTLKRTEVPKMKRAPQEYLRSGRVFVTCEADESTLECVVRLCGEDVVLYASDYPHGLVTSTPFRKFANVQDTVRLSAGTSKKQTMPRTILVV